MKVKAEAPVLGRPTLSLRRPQALELADELRVAAEELTVLAGDMRGDRSEQVRGLAITVGNIGERVKLLVD